MKSPAPPLPDRLFYALLATGILLNATGLVPPIMEPDGALYASIAKTMAQTGDFVNLTVQGRDWLDKPHFPFWVTAASYLIFGINSFAYKFPAFLFWLVGVAYTYRFARLAYPKLVAQVATIIVLTPYHLVLSNNDVRAEPYLTGLVVGAAYHFFRAFLGGKSGHLLAGAALTGCALMTKGPFVLMPVGAGLMLHAGLTGRWREFLQWRWLVAVLLVGVFTLPELLTLYLQFDTHPEKVVFGQTGVSGVRFFFWDSQFGRFFNTGPIKGAGDPFFFVHTLLWAFLPWSLLLYAAVGKAVWGLVKRQNPLPEYVSLGSGLATFVLFSASSFQLPHYLNIVFPFYAVLAAQFLASRLRLRGWLWAQGVVGFLLVAVAVVIAWFFRPERMGLALGWLVGSVVLTRFFFRKNDLAGLLGRTTGAAVALFGFLNLAIFPELLTYQAGMEAARFINRENTAAAPVGTYGDPSYSFDFYLNQPLTYHTDSTLRQQTRQRPAWVFLTAADADTLVHKGFRLRKLGTFSYFHVSQPSGEFLNKNTRASVLTPYVVAEVR